MARMRRLSAERASGSLASVVDRASADKERVLLTRRGKAVAAVVPVEDVAMLEGIEDLLDSLDLRKRLATWKREGQSTIALEDVAREHGVKL